MVAVKTLKENDRFVCPRDGVTVYIVDHIMVGGGMAAISYRVEEDTYPEFMYLPALSSVRTL